MASRTETAEISLHGCYIEANFTMMAGTKLQVELWVNEEKITTKAVVATHHPGFGNGLEFVGMSAEDEAKLKQFLATLE